MARSWEEIRNVVELRRSYNTATKERMIEIKDRYNGDYIIPLPSVKGHPEMTPPTARLLADGIDSQAMYASSVRPVVSVPALDGTKERGVRSREYAAIRRRALYGHWYDSQMDIQIRRAYRQLSGYGTMAWVVVPDFDRGIARIELRDSLTAYAEERSPEDIRRPDNGAFVFSRSADWIRKNYPGVLAMTKDFTSDSLWDLVEWIDEDIVSIGVLGPRNPPYYLSDRIREGEFSVELRRWPNRSEGVPIVCGQRVTLDRIMGVMENVIGTSDLWQYMMSLDVLAAEKAIFPDRFVVGQDGRPPQLLSGEWADGRTGKTNLLADVQQIGELHSSPGPLTHPVIDRLESGIRQSGGIPGVTSGIPNSSLRTGRSMDSFQQAAINPRIAEMQELMARALTLINESVIEMERGYFKNKKITMFSGWPSDKGMVEYSPKDHFETTANVVTYEYPGMDAAGAAVTSGQLVGIGMMSRATGMTRHPNIEDPEAEKQLIMEESLEQAVLASVQQQAVAGALPVIDVARIKALVAKGTPIDKAVLKADQEARERQAAEAPPPAEGQALAPGAQPGLAPPGVGAESQPPAEEPPPNIEAPGQGQQNLRQLLVALRRS